MAAEADEEVAANCIRFKVESVASLDLAGRRSECKEVQNFPFFVAVRRLSMGDKDFLGLVAACDMSWVAKLWVCDVHVDLSVINHKDPGLSVKTGPIAVCLNVAVSNARWDNLLPFEKALDPEEGFTVNDSILVEARFAPRGDGSKFRRIDVIRFRDPWPLSDVALVVEGVKLHVGKQFLAVHSSYFKSLFYGGYEEESKSEIVLPDLTIHEIVYFLNALYQNGSWVDDSTCEPLLKLADRFNCKTILDQVEAYLMGPCTRAAISKRLRLADEFRLATLSHYCITECRKSEQVKAVRASEDFHHLSNETKDELFGAYIALSERERARKRRADSE